MVPGSMVKKGFLKNLLVLMIAILAFFIILAGIFCYFSLHYELGPHYGAAYAVITKVKDSLALITLKVNFIFYLLIATGVAFLGIFYTHKIAGPFVRVKQFARSAERDKYMEKLSFRDKDAIKPLAQEINATIEAYREKLSSFSGELKELEDILNVAGKISGDGMDRAIMDDIIRVHESLKEEAARLKL